MISSKSVQKECTNTILNKRPGTEELLRKLEKVVKEHFKDYSQQGNATIMASSDILHWREICHQDIGGEKEQILGNLVLILNILVIHSSII